MSSMRVIIGNKNYSSWSLRGWLAARHVGAEFEEVLVQLDRPDTAQEIRRHSPSGLVPALVDGDLTVWDSLAICEYLAEQHPEAGMWPEDPAVRAHARSVAAEMHSGFRALRVAMPMNLRRKPKALNIDDDVRSDITRICAIWRDCRAHFATGDSPWLYGNYGVPDIMFTPVAWRFHSYAVDLDEGCAAYAEALRSTPAMKEWLDAALDEPWISDAYEL